MVKAKIESLLKENFHPIRLDVVDESHMHAGHNEDAKKGRTHFKILIVSDAFIGKSLVERHRMIYAALKTPIDSGVHAIAIQAKIPADMQRVAK